MGLAEPARLRISVSFSPRPRAVETVALDLDLESDVHAALRASGLLERYPDIDGPGLKVGVWGALVALDRPLRDGDRVEIYRPLTADPKEKRRRREQGSKTPRRR